MKRIMIKTITALLIALTIIIGSIPINVFAAGGNHTGSVDQTIDQDDNYDGARSKKTEFRSYLTDVYVINKGRKLVIIQDGKGKDLTMTYKQDKSPSVDGQYIYKYEGETVLTYDNTGTGAKVTRGPAFEKYLGVLGVEESYTAYWAMRNVKIWEKPRGGRFTGKAAGPYTSQEQFMNDWFKNETGEGYITSLPGKEDWDLSGDTIKNGKLVQGQYSHILRLLAEPDDDDSAESIGSGEIERIPCTITIGLNGGSLPGYSDGQKITLNVGDIFSQYPELDGYEFWGWSATNYNKDIYNATKQNAYNNGNISEDYVVTKDETIYAIFDKHSMTDSKCPKGITPSDIGHVVSAFMSLKRSGERMNAKSEF